MRAGQVGGLTGPSLHPSVSQMPRFWRLDPLYTMAKLTPMAWGLFGTRLALMILSSQMVLKQFPLFVLAGAVPVDLDQVITARQLVVVEVLSFLRTTL